MKTIELKGALKQKQVEWELEAEKHANDNTSQGHMMRSLYRTHAAYIQMSLITLSIVPPELITLLLEPTFLEISKSFICEMQDLLIMLGEIPSEEKIALQAFMDTFQLIPKHNQEILSILEDHFKSCYDTKK